MVVYDNQFDASADGTPLEGTAIRAGNIVYLSGTLGNTAETQGNPAAQTRETLDRLRAGLGAAGSSPADVVDALVYLPDLRNVAATDEVYRPFFGHEFPARTTVGAGLLASDALVEIMMTAVAR